MAATEDKLPISMVVNADGGNGSLVLRPASEYDYELLDRRYKWGDEVQVTFHSRKSRQQEKFFWLKVNRIVENTEYPDSYSLVKAAMIRLGYVNSVRLIGHKDAPPSFLVEPRSLSTFDKTEFSEFTDRFWHLIATEVIVGLDIKAFLDDGKVFVDEEIE